LIVFYYTSKLLSIRSCYIFAFRLRGMGNTEISRLTPPLNNEKNYSQRLVSNWYTFSYLYGLQKSCQDIYIVIPGSWWNITRPCKRRV